MTNKKLPKYYVEGVSGGGYSELFGLGRALELACDDSIQAGRPMQVREEGAVQPIAIYIQGTKYLKSRLSD